MASSSCGSLAGMFILMLVKCTNAQMQNSPKFLKALNCHDNKKVALRVQYARDKYVKINGCGNIQQVPNNGIRWIEMNCVVEWNTPFVATIASLTNAFSTGDVIKTFKCTAVDGVLQNIQIGFTGPTFTTGDPITDVVSATVSMHMTEGDGTTAATEGKIGDTRCLVVFLNPAFENDYSMQIITIKVKSGGTTIILTGENEHGCQSFDGWGLVHKVTEAKLKVCFDVFRVLPPTKEAGEQIFTASVKVCYSPELVNCDGISGCFPEPTARRRKRDVEGGNVTSAGSEEIELSASLMVFDDDVDDDSTNAGQTGEGQTGDAQQQVSTQEECEVCMKKSVLYGLIAFFVPALILAFTASLCFYLKSRKPRRKLKDSETEYVTRNTVSTVNSSFRNR